MERISLPDRLSRIKSGYPAFPEFVPCAIRSMAEVPLPDYLHAFPDKLERLREILGLAPEETAHMPYREAAKRIDQLWRVQRDRALLGEALDAMAAPIRKCYKERSQAYANAHTAT